MLSADAPLAIRAVSFTPGTRWKPLRPHAVQAALWRTDARFCVVEAGRRSGKSELAKRKTIAKALEWHETSTVDDALFVFAAPTREQVKSIYWEDLKRLVKQIAPSGWLRKVSESELFVDLANGVRIQCVGMDKPQRIEGRPIDWFCGDEMQEWKPGIYDRNVRPALETPDRPGSAWFYGVPRPGAEFQQLVKTAKGGAKGWAYFTWTSEGLISADSLASAKETMDERIFAQEFLAQRVAMQGRAYYSFEREVHAREELEYVPEAPLLFCFDFNVSPGIALVAQERMFRRSAGERTDRPEVADEITAFIGEVYIPHDSRTEHVCRKLVADWGHHKGHVICYGDATGGSRHTSQGLEGSDWQIIRSRLNDAFPGRVDIRHRRKNPPERDRVNAVNARFRSADGKVHALVSARCKETVEDWDATMLLEGGSGEIDKDRDKRRTHMSDAGGYLLELEHPLSSVVVTDSEII